jgi:hypothetical protein
VPAFPTLTTPIRSINAGDANWFNRFHAIHQEPVHKIKRYCGDRPPFSPRTAGISGVTDESRSHPILFPARR